LKNQVLVGPDTEHGRWYFSLNNRRLWVLKRCREEGFLSNSNNKILVRVRSPKSQAEMERYTIDNCAVDAKIIRERIQKFSETTHAHASNGGHSNEPPSCNDQSPVASNLCTDKRRNVKSTTTATVSYASVRSSDDDDDDDNIHSESCSSDDVDDIVANRFSALS
jgi:hypothetical protein